MRLAVAMIALALAGAAQEPAIDTLGPQVGTRVQEFSGVDQFGKTHTLQSLLGPEGLMLVFYRSADWWPYCKTQLVELQGRYEDLRRRGIGLAAISYDAPVTLEKFANARGITFPLISDPDSAIIKRYGIFNTTVETGNRAYGVPFPGTFMLDAKGIVRARYFEEAYQERNTAASILVRQGEAAKGPIVTADTRHLMMTASLSDGEVAPGERVTIVYEITPHRGMHVYAPGKHDYQVITTVLDPQAWLKAHPISYPTSEIYHFKPLDERVEVFMKPFRLVQDITLLATPQVQKMLANEKSLTITGRVNYQACDDTVCYTPTSVPVKWTVGLKQLFR